VSVAPDQVEIAFLPSGTAPPRPLTDLLIALPRPRVLARIFEHVAALGVDRILITNAWKVEKSFFQSGLLSPAGWRPHLLHGLEQAGHTAVPEVFVFDRFKPFAEDRLDGILGAGTRLLAHPQAAGTLWAAPLDGGARAAVAVGPEGGWIPYEVDALTALGFSEVRVSDRVLRSETACIAALAQIEARRSGVSRRFEEE